MKFVFDFGGVLFRWRPDQLVQRTLPQRATSTASASRWAAEIFQGYGGDWGEFDRGTIEPEALAQRIARRTGLHAAEARSVIEAVADELQPLPDSVALLRRLRAAGHATFFLSNMPAPIATQLEARHDFVREFDDGVFSAHVGLAKPDPEIFVLASRRFGTAPTELVFLDDHEPNVSAARALGWQALQFVDAARAERELRERGWM